MQDKQLCHDCKHLKGRNVGFVSSVYWCGLVGNGRAGTSIGILPWLKRPHPKCPLRKESKHNAG